MSKNLIYIIAIDHPGAKIPVSEYVKYSISTWNYYCEKYDIDLLVVDENQLSEFQYPICNKWMISVLGKEYDKIGIVDCDTMVKWDAPNIFDQIHSNKFYGVNDIADLNWLIDSIKNRQKFFPDVKMDIFKYINAGVVFFGNGYLDIFEELLGFYRANKSEIEQITTGGKEQTLLNFILQKNDVNLELLDPSWNLLSIHRKNMFTGNWQLKTDQTPYFIKYANIWHFTGFPIEDRIKVMEQAWSLIKHNYR